MKVITGSLSRDGVQSHVCITQVYKERWVELQNGCATTRTTTNLHPIGTYCSTLMTRCPPHTSDSRTSLLLLEAGAWPSRDRRGCKYPHHASHPRRPIQETCDFVLSKRRLHIPQDSPHISPRFLYHCPFGCSIHNKFALAQY